MNEDNFGNELNYDSNVGMSYGMYLGDAKVTVGDPYATYQRIPESYSFYAGIQESRF
jgi:hypothetical protein